MDVPRRRDADAIQGVTWPMVRDWLSVEFRPQNATLILVGDLPPASELQAQVDSALGSWSNRTGLLELLHLTNPPPPSTMLDAIDGISRAIAAAYALPADLAPELKLKGGSKVLCNDTGMAEAGRPVLRSAVGEDAVLTDMPKLMGSEDAHHLVLDNPTHRYLYMYVGTAKPEGAKKAREQGKAVPYANHNPDYRVELDAVPAAGVPVH